MNIYSIKEKFRNLISPYLLNICSFFLTNKKLNPVVIASSGRSGSTFLFKSIVKSYSKITGINKQFIIQHAFNLKKKSFLYNGVYKTHDFPYKNVKEVKYIFIYGDPISSLNSTLLRTSRDGYSWLKLHLEHLKSTKNIRDFYNSDILNYEALLKEWKEFEKKYPRNVLTIDFEKLWIDHAIIEDFLGINFNLGKKKNRKSDNNYKENKILNKLKQIYNG